MIARFAALAFALALSACVFSSERALFSEGQGAQPFADGARVEWREAGLDDGPMQVLYRRQGNMYVLSRIDAPDERPVRALFAPVRETPEEDYIVQVDFEDDGYAYAFMWRDGDRYLIFASPAVLDDTVDTQAAREALCQRLAYGECRVVSRADLHALYRRVVYPLVVRGGARHDDVMVQTVLIESPPK